MGDQTADKIRDAAQELTDALESVADELEQDDSVEQKPFNAREAVEDLIVEHPNLVVPETGRSGLNGHHAFDNAFYVGYETDGKPGKSNIGTDRTDAERTVRERYGCTFTIHMIETVRHTKDYDVLLSISAHPNDN